jgi:hypothetical protein
MPNPDVSKSLTRSGHRNEFVRIERALDRAAQASSSPQHGAGAFWRSAGSHWQCARRMLVTRFRRPTPWAGRCIGGGSPTSIGVSWTLSGAVRSTDGPITRSRPVIQPLPVPVPSNLTPDSVQNGGVGQRFQDKVLGRPMPLTSASTAMALRHRRAAVARFASSAAHRVTRRTRRRLPPDKRSSQVPT